MGVRFAKVDCNRINNDNSKVTLEEEKSRNCHSMQAFDVCVEASGSSQGILLAIQLIRPLGTVIQKSTCSAVGDPNMPDWSTIANQVVVDEKRLIGSRQDVSTNLRFPTFQLQSPIDIRRTSISEQYLAAYDVLLECWSVVDCVFFANITLCTVHTSVALWKSRILRV